MATTNTAPVVKSFSERAAELNLPRVVDRDFIAELGPVVWLSAAPAEARNPQTGQPGPGLLAQIETDDGKHYQSFIGNVALLQVLATATYDEDDIDMTTPIAYHPRSDIFPFRARIVKSGRTWTFAD